jgi:hypothetical protein
MINDEEYARPEGLAHTGDRSGGTVEEERNAAVPLLRTLESESESESMIGGSEVCSHRKE